MEKMASDGPKWGQEDFFPTNPDLADILGDTDFDFDNVVFGFFGIQNFQISRFQISKVPEIWLGGLGRAGPGLGQAGPSLAGLGPGGPSGAGRLTLK